MMTFRKTEPLQYQLLFWLLLLYGYQHVDTHLHALDIGVLIEADSTNRSLDKVMHAAVDIAAKRISTDPRFKEYHLRYVVGNSGCTGEQSIGEFARLKYKFHINAVIGPSCNEGCKSGGLLATYHNMPMLSHSCSTAKMSDKKIYPTFGRLRAYASASPISTGNALVRFFKSMDWHKVGIIHANEENWVAAAEVIQSGLESSNIRIPFEKDYIFGHQTSSADACMIALKKSAIRIILLLVDGQDALRLAKAAKAQGLYNGKYVFLSLDLYTWDSEDGVPAWLSSYSEDLLEGWFDISSRSLSTMTNTDQTFKKFRDEMQLRLLEAPFYVQVFQIHHKAFYIHDAVYAYALGVREAAHSSYIEHVVSHIYNNITNEPNLLASQNITNFTKSDVIAGIWPGSDAAFESLRNLTLPNFNFTAINSTYNMTRWVKDGKYVAEKIFRIDFQGVSGRVMMNARGNRVPTLVVRNFLSLRNPIEVARYDGISQTFTEISTDFTFASGSKIIPPDRAKCGFLDDPCQRVAEASASTVLIAILIPLSSLIVLFVLYRKYKKRKFENDIFNNKRSFLNYEDLIIQRTTLNEIKLNQSFDDLSSVQNDSVTERDVTLSTSSRFKDQNTAFIALYKHQNVFVKRLNKSRVQLDRDTLLEIKLARDIHHSNVNPYLGVVVQPPKVCVVSPYCTKGSLRDILGNEDITLDWVFRISFASDIAAGMAEVHEVIGPVGNLTSYNVLIDRRWTCQISDYGLDRFKEPPPHRKPNLTEEEKYKKLLWRAPELLSLTVNKKSKQGDVYSYGIILSEIITRMMPYENYGYPAKDVVHFVQRRCLPPFRPHVRLQSGLDGRILDLMRRCWHEFAAERPAFADIRKPLKSVMKDRNENQNLVDNMLEMMEKYTNHLERRVNERTEQLRSEKEKVESLLYTMLPKSIAHRLKMGELIQPEQFFCVSILLADIVDFSSITGTSTPMQVVDVLNDLTKMFDSIIERFDAFKFENYNEKYSIVSGCPKKNGIRHVKNIAMLALKMLGKMTAFRMRHRPYEILRLRICCHAGPVVGGLVGLRTPKYCIYGDSMSYITHLETTGPPLRIQISPEFKEKLNDVGSFETIIRGPVRVKGRGLVVSHFLTGKEGMDIELPEPEQDKGLELKDLGSRKASTVERKSSKESKDTLS